MANEKWNHYDISRLSQGAVEMLPEVLEERGYTGKFKIHEHTLAIRVHPADNTFYVVGAGIGSKNDEGGLSGSAESGRKWLAGRSGSDNSRRLH